MNIGFTGTRKGMTDEQKLAVFDLLLSLSTNEIEMGWMHNGLAIGADHDAAKIARSLGYQIKGYPSDRPEYTCNFIPDVYAQDPKPPLKRNPDIVNASRIMIATPGGFREKQRSGTWATIRYAQDHDVELFIVWPDGLIDHFPNDYL